MTKALKRLFIKRTYHNIIKTTDNSIILSDREGAKKSVQRSKQTHSPFLFTVILYVLLKTIRKGNKTGCPHLGK